MADQNQRFVRQRPLDVWTLRERLMLASSVLQSGDQNWVSVSRAIRNQSDQERPPEYFSQKNCALQYGELLEKAETPKRKRSEKNEVIPVETQGIQIVNKLKHEYMEHLVREITKHQANYQQLADDIEVIESGHCDEKLAETWAQIQGKSLDKTEEEVNVSVSQSETSPERDFTQTSLSVSVPDMDDTSTQDSQEADIEVDDHSQDVPGIGEEIETILEPEPPKDIENNPDTNTQNIEETSIPDITISFVNESNNELSQQESSTSETAIESTTVSVADTSEAADPETLPTGTADISTAEEEESSTENVTEKETKPLPEVNITLSEVYRPSIRSIKVVSVPAELSESTAPSEASEHGEEEEEELSVDDKVMPKPLTPSVSQTVSERSMPIPTLEKSQTEKPPVSTQSLEFERSISPESTLSSASDIKTKEMRTPTLSASSLRRSRRVTKKEDKKDEPVSVTPSVTKSVSELDLTSDDEEGTTSSKLVESAPESPSASHQSEPCEEDRLHRSWKKTIMMAWRVISHHKFANVFLHQVTDEIAPGYATCVRRPMSLSQIKQNVEKNVIRTTDEFTRDVMLMFVNAIMYNNHEYDVYAMAQEMYEDAMKIIEEHTENTGKEVDAKPAATLRGRRSESSVSFDKEGDKSRRRSSADQQLDASLSSSTSKKRKTRADD